MMENTEDRSLQAITEQAAEWFVAQREPLSDTERQKFVAWLQASPVHVREYLAIAAMSRDLAEPELFDAALVQRLLAEALQEPPAQSANVVSIRERLPMLAPVDASSSSWFSRWPGGWTGVLATSALIAVAAVAIWSLDGAARGRRYEVAGTGTGVWRLDDGSIMHLNAGSAARVSYSGQERLVELQRGDAMFEVSHQAQPFRVATDSADVVATGTAFQVSRLPQGTRVTVLDGSVAVTPDIRLTSPRSWLRGREQVQLIHGQGMIMSAQGVAEPPQTVQEREAVAWVRRDIVFERQPLSMVVAEFNRYTVQPFRIDDAELGKLRISGVFNAYDSRSFVLFLRRMPEVEVRIDADEVHVLRKPPQPAGTEARARVGSYSPA